MFTFFKGYLCLNQKRLEQNNAQTFALFRVCFETIHYHNNKFHLQIKKKQIYRSVWV